MVKNGTSMMQGGRHSGWTSRQQFPGVATSGRSAWLDALRDYIFGRGCRGSWLPRLEGEAGEQSVAGVGPALGPNTES